MPPEFRIDVATERLNSQRALYEFGLPHEVCLGLGRLYCALLTLSTVVTVALPSPSALTKLTGPGSWSAFVRATGFALGILLTTGAAILGGELHAQMRIDVSGVGNSQIPISISPFIADPRVPIDISAVVRSDLERSGAFRLIPAMGPLSDTALPDWAGLRARGADAVVGGSAVRLANQSFDVRFRLYDTAESKALIGHAFEAGAPSLRTVGHRISDQIYERLTGEKGNFSTRIAFVSKESGEYRLNIADWDGENVQTALTSAEPIISPRWSPDGSRLAYVSFETRKPVVYVQELNTQKRIKVADFKGSNSAPAWAPDGRSLAVVLTTDGLSQIYQIGLDGTNPRRVTRSSSIDTEPAFSADGQSIWFTSDRGGSPQIYRVGISSGETQRVTFGGPYNVTPRPSPDGRLLSYVSRRDGRFLVILRDLSSGSETVVSDGGRDESPSFSPNSRWILYSTVDRGRESLIAVTTDGRIRQRLSNPASDVREPAWGPAPN